MRKRRREEERERGLKRSQKSRVTKAENDRERKDVEGRLAA